MSKYSQLEVTQESTEVFVQGCDYILGRVALRVPMVGHGAFVFNYTKDSMTIEEIYDISAELNQSCRASNDRMKTECLK